MATSTNCFLKEWTLAEWAATGSIIGKETVEPAAPETATLVKDTTTLKQNKGRFTIPSLGGDKIVGLTLHLSAKTAAEVAKAIKWGFLGPAVFAEPTTVVAQSWYTVSLTKAQAEEQTEITLATLEVLLENLAGKGVTVYETYLTVEHEPAGGKENAATTADTVTVSSTATANVLQTRAVADTVAVSEGSTRTAAKARGAGDTVTVSESSAGQAGKLRTAADTVAVSEAVTRAAQAFARTTADAVSVSEASERTVARARTAADTVTTSSVAVRASVVFARPISEVVTVLEQMSSTAHVTVFADFGTGGLSLAFAGAGGAVAAPVVAGGGGVSGGAGIAATGGTVGA